MTQSDLVLVETAPAPVPPARRRFSPLRNIPYVVVGVYALAALLGPTFIDYDPVATFVTDRLLPPGAQTSAGTTALLGTDGVGRDVFAQIVYGARTSFVIGITVVALCVAIGVVLGSISGYAGGALDVLITRVIDILMAFHGILLAIVIAGLLDRGMHVVILALTVGGWVGFARLSRGITMSTRERDWVDAARIMGVPKHAILGRHVMPFLTGSVIALATIELASAVLAEAALSFLGLGLPPHIVSWGQSIASGRDYLGTAWWISVFPGLALTGLVVCVGLIGDRLTRRYTRSRD